MLKRRTVALQSRERWRAFLDWLHVHEQTRWVFRGEPRCRTQLRPAIGRRRGHWSEERELLLYALFARKSRPFKTNGADLSFAETMAWAQHHGLPTRLLDWTTNPFAAVYFALQDGTKLGAHVHTVDAAEVGFFQDSEVASASSVRGLQATRFIELPPLSPRIAAQSGLFSLHHEPARNWKPTGRRVIGEDSFFIGADARPYFLQRLFQMGVDASSVMTDLDGLCASLKWWCSSGLQTPSTIGRRITSIRP